MLARPLFREKHEPDMSEDDAMQLMKEALKVLCHTHHCMRLQSVLSHVKLVATRCIHGFQPLKDSWAPEYTWWYQSAWYLRNCTLCGVGAVTVPGSRLGCATKGFFLKHELQSSN